MRAKSWKHRASGKSAHHRGHRGNPAAPRGRAFSCASRFFKERFALCVFERIPLWGPGRAALPRWVAHSRKVRILTGESVKRSEEVGHQGGGLSGIGSIRLPKLGAHPFLLHAELEPEHEEDEDENDEPAHLGDCN